MLDGITMDFYACCCVLFAGSCVCAPGLAVSSNAFTSIFCHACRIEARQASVAIAAVLCTTLRRLCTRPEQQAANSVRMPANRGGLVVKLRALLQWAVLLPSAGMTNSQQSNF